MDLHFLAYYVTTLGFSASTSTEDGSSTRTRPRQESAVGKAQRLKQAETRKIPKMSPWNAFQRAALQGKKLNKQQYAEAVSELSTRWKEMTAQDKEAYAVEASHQQGLLDELED